MNSEDSGRTGLRQTVIQQLEELAAISLYLSFVFCAVATYRLLLLNEFHISYFDYGAALFNAVVISKVILIGRDVHLGKRHEGKPLLLSAVYKAFLFGLLVFSFHIVEEVAKRLLHGQGIMGALHDTRIDDLVARCVVVFGTFIPLFGFLELRRAIGEQRFYELTFRTGSNCKT